ncbi:caspase family protein [Emticicia sp. 21SJ11W-3]|uniref:caspase family protein n=1 Tax=Emticicia sp. 21SJ11W-3 TaxID=2916755 RepID=UPI00209FF96D|nr:caspase family protein [Emticicia sp. 21SJ11W-3]UTA66957.1 caspase family protein [Emticicia sp. 21SJ11W-3]
MAIPGQVRKISEKLEVNLLSEEKPPLYIVSVGVSSDLNFTQKDAESIYNIFNGQFASLFQTVRGELLVCPENTTKAKIATTIEKIKFQGLRRNDVLILFFSGHGINSLNDSDDFYLETSDANASISRYSLISYQNDVIDNIKDLDCKRIILIDACQSGAARQNGQKTGAIDYGRIQRIISQTPPSIITLTSSPSNESSIT